MQKTIKVTGKGTISVKPDTIRLGITLRKTDMVYAAAVNLSARQTEELRDELVGAGFDREALKTLSFCVEPKYEGYQDEHNRWVQKFTGYECHHQMKLEFDADNKTLGSVLYALARAKSAPEFTITYIVKEPEAARELLLKQAVSDSRRKAQVLAEAAGITLGKIVHTDYSWESRELTSRPMNHLLYSKQSGGGEAGIIEVDLNPENILAFDIVTIEWEIIDN